MMRAARVFKCGRTSLQRSKETRNSYKTTKLKHELKKLERNDVIYVLDEQKGDSFFTFLSSTFYFSLSLFHFFIRFHSNTQINYFNKKEHTKKE